MLQLDHLTIIAPSLVEGVEHVRRCLDIDIPYGRVHDGMGTHNHLLRLGDDVYLEVIAVNPDAPRPDHPRWFGLDDATGVRIAWDRGLRLRGWVARTRDIDAVLSQHGHVLGNKIQLSRAGVSFSISVPADGSLPLGGVAPTIIDRGDRPLPVVPMPDLGARLHSLALMHPKPDDVVALYKSLRIENPPHVRMGDEIRYTAAIQTSTGLRSLN